MITFDSAVKDRKLKVFLDKKLVGEIREVLVDEERGSWGFCTLTKYQYFPKGCKKGGDYFDTLKECKLSLGM